MPERQGLFSRLHSFCASAKEEATDAKIALRIWRICVVNGGSGADVRRTMSDEAPAAPDRDRGVRADGAAGLGQGRGAKSLALSSPALTRRIQALERHVGRPLFERRHQAVQLNPDGERLLAEIGPALDELGQAMERASGAAELMRLKLAVLPLFASYRLMPRLGALRALHPELHIDIDTRPHALARLDEGLDAAIVLAREVEPPLYSVKLGSNRVVAIGGEALRGMKAPGRDRRRHRASPPRPARRVRLLARGGRPARPRAGGGRPFRFRPADPRRRRPGAGRRLHVRDAPRRRARPAPRTGCSTSRSRAPMPIGSPAAARRWDGGRSGSSTTGWSGSWVRLLEEALSLSADQERQIAPAIGHLGHHRPRLLVRFLACQGAAQPLVE